MGAKLKDYFSSLNTRINWTETRLILLVAVAVGIVGGYSTVLFRWLIDAFKLFFFRGGTGDNLLSYAWTLPWWQRMLIPVAGALLLAPLLKLLTREGEGQGVSHVMESLVLRGGRVKRRTMFTAALNSAVTLGSGGSAGREGPIVQIGAAIGSTFGQFLNAGEDRMKTLVGCGAAAGIAATFNAPLGGALFAIEVILGDFGLAQVTPIIISSVAATAVSRHYLGDFPSFEFHPPAMASNYEFLIYAVLGILCGVLAWVFISALYTSEDVFAKLRMPGWLKPTIGGLVVGVFAIWFPHIYSSGYEAINLALDSQLTLPLLLILVVVKVIATSITLGSGGRGGEFAPSLFMGAMLGGAVGALFHMAFPAQTVPYGSYALAGMGAMIAGTMHAPITVILIIFELTGDYMIILPVMTACILSTLMSHKLLGGETVYTRKLIREGINLYRGRDLNVLSGLKVSDVMSQDVAKVDEGEPLSLLIRRAIAHPQHTYVQVDEDGRISGLISLQRILEVMRDENLRDILVAQDVALLEVPVLRADESLDEVIRRVGEHGLEEVPVTDPANPGVVIGVVRHNDIMQAYRRAIIQQDMSGFVADNLVRDPERKEVELVDGYRMVEIKAPWNFRGKSIRELDISNRYGVQVILIRKKQHDSRKKSEANGAAMNFVPRGDDVIEEGDVLVLVGDNKHLRKFTDI